ncbi:hypothetical protein SAMN05192576_0950 [Nocardioides szechwanensis]|uniref:Uncharacterized protein n=1 Tax=Nocardioides szechwanensis TaxID=1005944 RepID=A0A1G9W522_9ACTN|nr:hypothetical protein SAMN05192576_0950 [Nocardioides szechwanensis]
MFSLSENDYWVLCRSHHQRWDRGYARTVPVGATSLAHLALAMAYDPDYGQVGGANEYAGEPGH